MQELNESCIPYNCDLYKIKNKSNRLNTVQGIHRHCDNQFLESVASEIYLIITEEKIKDDLILRLNNLITKYYKEIVNSNLSDIVSNITSTLEIIQSEYMKQNRKLAISILNQRLNY